jgi:hypothetical protein
VLKSPKHMIVDIIRVEDGLVKYRDTFPGGPAAFFADVAQVTYVTKDLIFILQTLLGDAVVVRSTACQLWILPYIHVPSGQRYIAVMSCGSLCGLSSFQACYGAVAQVSRNHVQEVVCSQRCLEVTGFLGIYSASEASARTGSIFATTTALWVTAFFALSVSTNLMGSGKYTST